MTSAKSVAPEATQVRMLLARLGTSMIATGQPVHEIRQEMAEVSAHLGYPEIQVRADPTSIILVLSSGAPVTYEAVTDQLRLDQAADVSRIRHQLLADEIEPDAALLELESLRDKPARYPSAVVGLGTLAFAAGVALIMQPAWANVAVSAFCAGLLLLLYRVGQRVPLLTTLLPTVGAFVVSCSVFLAASAHLIDGPLRTALPPLALLLPGSLIVTGMSELAAGDIQAGSARLNFGLVRLGLFALGVATAGTLLHVPYSMWGNVRVAELGWWSAPVGLVVMGLGVCLLESLKIHLLPWIVLVLLLAFTAQSLGHALGPAGLGSLLGAITASLASSLVEAARPQLPKLVVFLPAFWLLVPGALGLVSVSDLAVDPTQALDVGVGVAVEILAIALGLLIGTVLAGPIRALIGHRRRARTVARQAVG